MPADGRFRGEHPVATEIYDRWIQRLPDVRRMYHTDALFHASMRLWHDALALNDCAMEDEGIDRETRTRVLERVIFGSPNPGDALRRDRERVDALAKVPGLGLFTKNAGGHP